MPKEYKVVATYETKIEISQEHDWQLCDTHQPTDGETLEQLDARMWAVDSCSACDEKAWAEAYDEAYGKFSDADDLEVI